jgi:DNA helicase-2/ATP-dependent DNA helicase PcrA
MLSTNDVIIAAAGGGKTTNIVTRALEAPSERSALVTYTQNNV